MEIFLLSFFSFLEIFLLSFIFFLSSSRRSLLFPFSQRFVFLLKSFHLFEEVKSEDGLSLAIVINCDGLREILKCGVGVELIRRAGPYQPVRSVNHKSTAIYLSLFPKTIFQFFFSLLSSFAKHKLQSTK